MSRKRRFKRKTLGRLQMFFGKKAYTGHTVAIQVKQYSTHMEGGEFHVPDETHYKICYKKKNILPRLPGLLVSYKLQTIPVHV